MTQTNPESGAGTSSEGWPGPDDPKISYRGIAGQIDSYQAGYRDCWQAVNNAQPGTPAEIAEQVRQLLQTNRDEYRRFLQHIGPDDEFESRAGVIDPTEPEAGEQCVNKACGEDAIIVINGDVFCGPHGDMATEATKPGTCAHDGCVLQAEPGDIYCQGDREGLEDRRDASRTDEWSRWGRP